MVDKKVILNDCFKTKKASFTNIEKSLRGLKPEKVGSENNDILEFSVDDPQLLSSTPGEPTQLAYYNYFEAADPRDNYYEGTEEHPLPGKWTLANPSQSDMCRNCGHTKNNDAWQITNVPTAVSGTGVSWASGQAIHFNRKLTSQTIRLINSIDRCVADITLAVPSKTVLRQPSVDGDIIQERSWDLDYYYWDGEGVSKANNPIINQRNFITIGADDGKLNMRFLLRFDNIVSDISEIEIEQEDGGEPRPIGPNGQPGVYFLDVRNERFHNFYSSLNHRYPIPEFNAAGEIIGTWDGDNYKKFKFILERNLDDVVVGKLYVESPTGELVLINKDSTGQPIDILASNVNAIDNTATEFGEYSATYMANIAVQKVDVKAYSKANYNFTLKNKDENKSFTGSVGIDGDVSNTGPQKLINYFTNRYTYNIGLSDNTYSYTTWFFNGTIDGNQAISASGGYIVKPDKNRFTVFNHTDYNGIQKKDKHISITTDNNSIRSFINPNKYIYDINLKGLAKLETVDLSNNMLKSLDLTDNTAIKNIDVSGNTNLETLYLPYFTSTNTSSSALTLNLTDTQLKFLQIINDKATTQLNPPLFYVVLKLVSNTSTQTELPSIEKIDIQRIAFTTYDDIYSPNVLFPNVKEINISETNILTNRDNLISFIGKLPDRTGKEPGVIYMYGEKYTYSGTKGSAKAIAAELEVLKNKNWLFYL